MMQSNSLLTAMVVIAGALLPVQALINARLAGVFSHPFWAAACQNIVGALAMVMLIAFTRTPALTVPAQPPPWWYWVGGMLGMVYVFAGLSAAPRIGALSLAMSVIAGQLVSSVLLDHFGVLHARRPITLEALGGIALVMAGAYLILRPK